MTYYMRKNVIIINNEESFLWPTKYSSYLYRALVDKHYKQTTRMTNVINRPFMALNILFRKIWTLKKCNAIRKLRFFEYGYPKWIQIFVSLSLSKTLQGKL